MRWLLLIAVLAMAGCTGVPEGVTPVDHFDAARYSGRWYEIARLDHAFERGLIDVTATYSARDDGGIRVLNRGYDPDSKTWKEAEGKAYFVGDERTGHLKVSFFGPFYGSYVIFALDHEHYQYAAVAGPDRSYLWLLARTPQPDAATVEALLQRAEALGFDTSKLIRVEHRPAGAG
jgi:apolipoprotein D and lipocalin family protein